MRYAKLFFLGQFCSILLPSDNLIKSNIFAWKSSDWRLVNHKAFGSKYQAELWASDQRSYTTLLLPGSNHSALLLESLCQDLEKINIVSSLYDFDLYWTVILIKLSSWRHWTKYNWWKEGLLYIAKWIYFKMRDKIIPHENTLQSKFNSWWVKFSLCLLMSSCCLQNFSSYWKKFY